jgi:hypothetical protein
MLTGIALEIAFSWAILYYPPAQAILATGPVSPILFACAWLGIPLLFGLDLLRKRVLSGSGSLVATQTTINATAKPPYQRQQSLTTQA